MALEGRLLDGKYVIVRPLAEGGTSTVYLGRHERLGKDVAVKVLRAASVLRDPDTLKRFEREARITSRIRSPHVADVYDYGELPTGEPFMVMEYLEGESLARILEREHTIPRDRLAAIALSILDALAAAHRAGVIHRDLKPENVIVTTRGEDVLVKVVDFGISMLVEPASPTRVRLTSSGSVLGTPLYMSPEQARGQTNLIDQRTDIYSLGVLLYEATAGEPPLTGDNVNELLFRVALDDPAPLKERVPSVDPVLAAIIHRAIEKAPADRYQTADQMREAIERWRNKRIEPRHVDVARSSEILSDSSYLPRAWAFVLGAAVAAVVLWLGYPLLRPLQPAAHAAAASPEPSAPPIATEIKADPPKPLPLPVTTPSSTPAPPKTRAARRTPAKIEPPLRDGRGVVLSVVERTPPLSEPTLQKENATE